MDEMIGCVLGERYRIDARIGEGGMGVVYRAYQSDLERFVAIKLPHKARAFDRTHLQRFAREAQVLSRLLHPNIAAVQAAGSAPDGRPFLSMELVEGVPLSQLLADPELQHRMRCLPMLIDVAGALAHALDRGVVHRDLKGANVMVVQTEAGESAKVLDFGVSKLLDAQTEGMKATATGCVIGSPAYMSPEQFTDGVVTARSDIYSFGCLLYEMLAGHPPFQHEAVYSMLQAHLHETAKALSFPPELQLLGTKLELVAAKAMQKDPPDRFAEMSELHDLLQTLARDPMTPLGFVLPTEMKRAGRRRFTPQAVATGCAVVCLTLAMVAGYDWLDGRRFEVADAENSLAHSTTASILFHQKKLDEAESEARTALAQAKNPFQRRTALLTLARCLEESPHEERHVLAIPMFEELLQQALKEPKRTEYTLELVQRGLVSTAEIAVQAQLPQAERLARRAYDAREFFGPEDWRRPRLMAAVARRRGDFKTAVLYDDEMLRALDWHTPPEVGTPQMAAVAAEDNLRAGGSPRQVKAKILKILQRPQAEEESNDALLEALDRALGLGK